MKVGGVGLLGSLAVFALGCAHEFVYLPVGAGTTGGPAAQYPIPPNNPQGEVYVTSFGFTDMDTGSPAGPLLHVRLAVSNGSPLAWSIDAQQQLLVAPGQPMRAPTLVNTDAAGAGPTYQIPPGRANVFDLYFDIPSPLDQASDLGGFSLDWNVNAGAQTVAEATSFERFQEQGRSYVDYPPYVTVGLGFGLGWWGPPFFPYGRFSPVVRGYYYPPHRVRGGPWRGPRPIGWGARPPGGGWAHGGFHGGVHAGGHHR